MPRPQKKRNICQLPNHVSYGPYQHSGSSLEKVMLLVDELETIRLIDFEGYNQEEAAKQMNVARTTVQRIYNDARKKIADSLVNGKKLVIGGGEFVICDRNCDQCKKPRRLQNRLNQIVLEEEPH
jgi:predicted DNA-binding protein (UPF0251 family)